MELTSTVIEFITAASNKALATRGAETLNVVPVSAMNAEKEVVYLYDFFMQKTAENLQQNPEASLVCWDGMCGVQIKFIAAYKTAGEEFTSAESWVAEKFPDRTLRGLICLTPQSVHDVSICGNKVISD